MPFGHIRAERERHARVLYYDASSCRRRRRSRASSLGSERGGNRAGQVMAGESLNCCLAARALEATVNGVPSTGRARPPTLVLVSLSLSVFLLFLWVFFFSILDYCTQCASPIFPVSLRYTQILSQARSTQLHILRILFYRFILLPAADGVSPFSRYANHLTGGYSFFFPSTDCM